MLLLPQHQPIIEGLNSYYLNVRKFFEHHHRELGTFGIHMKSPRFEGMVYFDSGQFISAICLNGGQSFFGEDAFERLMSAVEKYNFSVSVYAINPEMIFFWANALQAQPLHRDLTTDITDLDRLITNMINQQLTGFIEIFLADDSASAILFFNSGKILGASTSPGETRESIEVVRDRLVKETNAKGGVFHISTISISQKNKDRSINPVDSEAEHPDPVATPSQPATAESLDPLPMLEEVLRLSEAVCMERKRVKDFPTQFRKAAMELADKYSFLDPFLKEFEFSGGKVRLEGNVPSQALVGGVLECIQKVLGPLGLTDRFNEKADGWFRKNANTLKDLGFNRKQG
jgi:hypothetical protein